MKLDITSKKLLLILTGFVLSPSFALATFGDVPSGHPNSEAISYIQAKNIVSGYPDGTFRPDNSINRAEFTKIIIESYFQGQAEGADCFPDVGTEWFAKYVCFAKSRDFIAGYPDGSFYPDHDINFVEVAKILANANGFVASPDPSVWYRPYVKKMEEMHAIPPSIMAFSQKVTRGEMAEMIYRLKTQSSDVPIKTYEELAIESAAVGLPVRLKIPGINVDSSIEYVGLTPDGAVGIPVDPANAAWYDLSPFPGDVGSAVITGHINWYNNAIGVFANLSEVKPGDRISVTDVKGAVIPFVVREIRSYDALAQATDVFISNDGKAHLNLITCEGEWDRAAKRYSHRLVVFADREQK